MKDGFPGDLPPVEEKCPNDEFENAIRKYGIINACEWFGHTLGGEFTIETIKILRERGNA